ncbi:hypothetical protein [Streptomyces sp. NPDC046821]|uniref:hypothetical protein n=1 Tax=Streptomyces sp. NPDC046821 TaxID=3154702 RepID=UPI00340738D6
MNRLLLNGSCRLLGERSRPLDDVEPASADKPVEPVDKGDGQDETAGGGGAKKQQARRSRSSGSRTDQGPPQRIDLVIGTPDLAPALIEFRAVAGRPLRDHFDHALLFARFNLAELWRILCLAD